MAEFTRKQLAALRATTNGQWAKMRASFAKQQNQQNKNPPRRGKNGPRASRRVVPDLATNAVAVAPARAFGGGRRGFGLDVWNALKPAHLPLPSAVGPYTIVRSTRRFSSASPDLIFGTFSTSIGVTAESPGNWTNICCLAAVAGGTAVNGVNNTVSYSVPLNLGEGATLTPSAITVQIMNPNALQTTNGITSAGIATSAAAFQGSAATWDATMDGFVSYMQPRLVSAAKLALRGCEVSSYPLNMGALETFTSLTQVTNNFAFTWTTQTYMGRGFAPIYIANPDAINIDFQVTMEFRVRFDMFNPASAGHTHHPVASQAQWDGLMKQASALGHGVRDMVDTAAAVGAAVAPFM